MILRPAYAGKTDRGIRLRPYADALRNKKARCQESSSNRSRS